MGQFRVRKGAGKVDKTGKLGPLVKLLVRIKVWEFGVCCLDDIYGFYLYIRNQIQ